MRPGKIVTVFTILGSVATILALIVTVATDSKLRVLIGLENADIKQQSVSEPQQQSVSEPLKVSYSPFEYTVHEHQAQFVKDAQASLSVIFRNIEGEEFVSLNISPVGGKASVHAVLNGYTEEFRSSSGVFNVQVLNIDYENRKVVVQVSRKF